MIEGLGMMRTARLVLALAALLTRASGSYSGIISLYGSHDAIAGYTPATDVTEHADIDLDMIAIINALDGTEAGYAAAVDLYTSGGDLAKGAGARTFQGLSKAFSGETEWEAGAAYWGSDTYADEIVMNALNGPEYTYMYTASWGSCREYRRRAISY